MFGIMASARSENSRRITESQKQRENRAIAAEKLNPPPKSQRIRPSSPVFSNEEQSDDDEEPQAPPPKPRQKISIEDWTYQLVVAAYCGKNCVCSKVKPTKINQANIRVHDKDMATAVRHEILKDKGNTQWTRDYAVASLLGLGMSKVELLIKDSLEWWDIEENLKDYWEKDIKKVRVEYKVKYIVQVPEKDSDVEEIDSLTASRGKGKRALTDPPTLLKKRRVYLVI